MSGAPTELKLSNSQASFVRCLGHELHTQLNTIIGTSTLFRLGAYTGVAFTGRPASAMDRIVQTADRVAVLVDRALLYMCALSGASTSISRPVVLSSLIDAAAGRAQNRQPFTFRREATPGAPDEITGDPAQIGIILDELLSNACLFGLPGEPISVRVERGAGDRVQLSVSDRGPGISNSDQLHVFKPFWRGEAAQKRAPQGIGLGLSIVREMTRAMGGEVAIISRAGTGTTVQVSLPLVVVPRPE